MSERAQGKYLGFFSCADLSTKYIGTNKRQTPICLLNCPFPFSSFSDTHRSIHVAVPQQTLIANLAEDVYSKCRSIRSFLRFANHAEAAQRRGQTSNVCTPGTLLRLARNFGNTFWKIGKCRCLNVQQQSWNMLRLRT